MSFNDFFMHHLEDEIQNRYSLNDDEMGEVMQFLKEFDTDGLKKMHRKENRGHLESVMQNVLKKELQEESHKDMGMAPVTQQDTLTFPMGIPLSQQQIQLEPHHYDGGYTF